jgi:hypothetical protein
MDAQEIDDLERRATERLKENPEDMEAMAAMEQVRMWREAEEIRPQEPR